MPEAFGLHENCNITCAQDEALKLLTGMQSMAPSSLATGAAQAAQISKDAIEPLLPSTFCAAFEVSLSSGGGDGGSADSAPQQQVSS